SIGVFAGDDSLFVQLHGKADHHTCRDGVEPKFVRKLVGGNDTVEVVNARLPTIRIEGFILGNTGIPSVGTVRTRQFYLRTPNRACEAMLATDVLLGIGRG